MVHNPIFLYPINHPSIGMLNHGGQVSQMSEKKVDQKKKETLINRHREIFHTSYGTCRTAAIKLCVLNDYDSYRLS
jgi:hypothetical protein